LVYTYTKNANYQRKKKIGTMILIDNTGRLVSTKSIKELHEFAKKLGLKQSWYQSGKQPHYKTKNKIYDAIVEGARRVDPKELARKTWWNNNEK